MARRWTRRAVLASFSAGIAGCTGGPTGTSTEEPDGTPTESPTPTLTPVETRTFPDSYYQGPLISAHEHMNGPGGFHLDRERLVWFTRWMERNGVAKAMAITPEGMADTVEPFTDRLIPFLFGEAFLRDRFDPMGLADPMKMAARDRDLWQGLGEFGLYPMAGEGGRPVPPDHEGLLELYDVAAEQGYPVMVHAAEPWRYPEDVRESWETRWDCPTLAQLERAYEHNRDTQFLVHGSYFSIEDLSRGEVIARHLERHPNLHYDVSGIAPHAYQAGPKAGASMSQEEFEGMFAEKGVEGHAEDYYDRYRPVLEEYSDRALWGMDASLPWHFNDWAMDAWIDVGRSLLGRLPSSKARDVGYRTAEDLFGVSVGGD